MACCRRIGAGSKLVEDRPYAVVTHIVEIAAASWNTLLDANDDIARDVQPILNVDVCPAKAVYDARSPEEERDGSTSGGLHHSMRLHEYASALT
jgi:hypothetical protein